MTVKIPGWIEECGHWSLEANSQINRLREALFIAWEALTLAPEKHPGAKVVCELAKRRIEEAGK